MFTSLPRLGGLRPAPVLGLLLLVPSSWPQQHDKNPFTSFEDIAEGRRLYRLDCVNCHGMDGASGRGTRLASKYRRYGSSDREMFQTISNGVPGTEMPGLYRGEEAVWKTLAFVRTLEAQAPEPCVAETGDPSRGRDIFTRKAACQTCHTVAMGGGRLGPDLTAVGARLSDRHLRESLLEPNKEIPYSHRTVRAVGRDGKRFEGVLLNEDGYTLHLMDRQETIHSLSKADLRKIERPQESLMPDYSDLLSPAETDDPAGVSLQPGPEGRSTSAMRKLVLWLTLAGTAWSQVTNRDLVDAGKTSGNWLTYSGDYAGHRHSGLNEINPENAGKLQVKWVFQQPIREKFETTPLVVDGVMYLTVPPNDAYALDAETGVVLWKYQRALPPKIIVCCGQVNRGLAVLGDRLFMATLDAKVIALDRKTGRLLWESEMIDYRLGYAATHAPLVIKDKVLVGVAGGEYGIRGFIDAYSVEDGKRLWRFYTVPGPGEFGRDTWEGDSWKTGGASVWITGSYDPDLNLTYWGTGNPGPDWNGDVRLGDNLFSDAVVALDPDTGERKWHFQFTPHDIHDWDATQIMVLIDREFQGRARELLITANRNGFYYVLDRRSGEFLHASPFVKQTWAERIDKNGRPIRVPGKEPTEEGNLVYPTVAGGTNWMSPTYSPLTGLYYVTAREGSSVYFKGEVEYKPGTRFWGGHFRDQVRDRDWKGAVRALDPLTGKLVWEHEMFSPAWAGLVSTAGGLVFVGTEEGYFKALDAKTGEQLWYVNLGGRIAASPMTYLSKGRQHVAIASGSGLFVFTIGPAASGLRRSLRDDSGSGLDRP